MTNIYKNKKCEVNHSTNCEIDKVIGTFGYDRLSIHASSYQKYTCSNCYHAWLLDVMKEKATESSCELANNGLDNCEFDGKMYKSFKYGATTRYGATSYDVYYCRKHFVEIKNRRVKFSQTELTRDDTITGAAKGDPGTYGAPGPHGKDGGH